MRRTLYFVLSVFVLLTFQSDYLFSGAEENLKKQKIEKRSIEQTPGKVLRAPGTQMFRSDSLGLAKYQRPVLHDGNRISSGVLNGGFISNGNNPDVTFTGWPKGSNLGIYLYGAYFFVAAEVIDTSGHTLGIVSEHSPYNELAPDGSHYYHFQPLPKYFNLDEPFSGMAPEIGGISEDLGIDGIPSSNDFGEDDGILQPEEDYNGNGILDLSMQNEIGWFAINDRRETWPEYWPVGSYPEDNRAPGTTVPGTRASRWNGAYGAFPIADQESYYVMDDRENDEFGYHPFDDPTPWPLGKQGLGVTVEVRHYQWAAAPLQDILVATYDVTNKGKNLNKSVVGMFIDPDVGDNFQNDNGSFDAMNDIAYAWDNQFLTSTGIPLGYIAIAFLEGPGNAYDGLDNDQDGLTDESRHNGIDDDGDWRPWEDLNGNGILDNEDLNYNGVLDPGEDTNNNGILDYEPLHDDVGSDGIGPDMQPHYTGPDADGSEANGLPDIGESNFEVTDHDETDQIGLTTSYFLYSSSNNRPSHDQAFWQFILQPGTMGAEPGWQQDVALTYGSGYAELLQNEPQRYVTAFIFSYNFDAFVNKKAALKTLYDNDFMYHDSLVAIESEPEPFLAKEYKLAQNYPNPFNPVTNITYTLPKATSAKLIIYDILGRTVAVLVDEMQQAGEHTLQWQADAFPSGVYYYSLQADGYVLTKKMLLLK